MIRLAYMLCLVLTLASCKSVEKTRTHDDWGLSEAQVRYLLRNGYESEAEWLTPYAPWKP